MTDIVPGSTYLPALTLAQAAERRNAIIEFTRMAMHANVDFGVIPGTDKPTLLKPGAEKLCTQFGLSPSFEPVEVIRDWTGKTTDGEPLFFYEYRCRLSRDGRVVGEGIGSCNSWEKKYRWRNADRRCPSCGAPAIKKSKFAPKNTPKNTPPGWYCYAKVGGCGADDTHRLSIEVAERTGMHRPWVTSGIFADHRAHRYAQGTPRRFWVFTIATLRDYYHRVRPEIIDDNPPTIRKFYIPVNVADRIAESVWTPIPNEWYTTQECDVWLIDHGYTRGDDGRWIGPAGVRYQP